MSACSALLCYWAVSPTSPAPAVSHRQSRQGGRYRQSQRPETSLSTNATSWAIGSTLQCRANGDVPRAHLLCPWFMQPPRPRLRANSTSRPGSLTRNRRSWTQSPFAPTVGQRAYTYFRLELLLGKQRGGRKRSGSLGVGKTFGGECSDAPHAPPRATNSAGFPRPKCCDAQGEPDWGVGIAAALRLSPEPKWCMRCCVDIATRDSRGEL